MQHHGWTSKMRKRARYNRGHTLWCHLYEVLGQAKRGCGQRYQNNSCLGCGGGSIQRMKESSRKNPMVMGLFCILMGVWVTQVSAIFKTSNCILTICAFYCLKIILQVLKSKYVPDIIHLKKISPPTLMFL